MGERLTREQFEATAWSYLGKPEKLIREIWPIIDRLQQENERLERQGSGLAISEHDLMEHVAKLEQALKDALDLAEEGWAYASPYVRDHRKYLEQRDELRAALHDR